MFTEELCGFIHRTNFEDIPQDVKDAAKAAILDNIAVTMSGSQEPSGQIMIEMVKENQSPPEATVIGGHFKASTTLAALANGTSAHTQDYDDCLDFPDAGLAHPTAGTFSGMLTLGEKHHTSGKDLLTGYILGVEAYGKIGLLVVESGVGDRGWEWTGTLGVMGGTMGLAKMFSLDVKTMINALGIATTQANSRIKNFGSFAGHIHGGIGARNAIESVILAMKGYDATGTDIIEGFNGYYNGFSGKTDILSEEKQRETLAMLGNPWNLINPGLMFKYYPCCHIGHFGAYGAQLLREKYNIDWREIETIEFRQPQRLARNTTPPPPENGVQGRFSMAYCLCRTLIHGYLDFSFFKDDTVFDPDTRSLLDRLSWTVQEQDELPGPFGYQEVVLKMKDGSVYSQKVDHPKGEPQNPLSPEEHEEKFWKCGRYANYDDASLGKVRDMIMDLENVKDVSELTGLLA